MSHRRRPDHARRTDAGGGRPRAPGSLPGPLLGAVWLAAIAVPVLPARDASAQSLLAREGLGLPVEAIDARARGLGSSGVGLTGWYISQADPAANAGLLQPSVSASFQPASATLTDGREAGFARFPTLAASYPVGGNVFSIQAGSLFDQEWEVRVDRTLVLAGDEVPAQDLYSSRGGIGRVQLGWARRIVPELAVGVTFGSHVGTLERVFQRSILEEDALAEGVGSFRIRGRLRASGVVAGVGVVWDPLEIARVSASVVWSDELELSPSGGSETESGAYGIPLELRGGSSFTLTGGLGLHVSGSYADWSGVADDLQDATVAGARWSLGGGMEWTGTDFLGRSLPLRLGARHSDLPFQWEGASITEQTLSGGIGLHLVEVEGEDEPRARADFGIERGSREGGTLSESFWRMTVTVRVSTG